MVCPDCGSLRHQGDCVEYELDIWFWQDLEPGAPEGYGEWIFDTHCTLNEFLDVNGLEPEDAVSMHILCEIDASFTFGGGASPLHLVMPSRPTIH